VDSYIALNYWELAAASVLVFINAGLSVIFGLRVHRSLLIAAIRMVVQLALVGVVLTMLFSLVSPLWTGLTALGMVLFAGHEAAQRQERGLSGWWSYGLGTATSARPRRSNARRSGRFSAAHHHIDLAGLRIASRRAGVQPWVTVSSYSSPRWATTR
jgi:ABC-type iron transport system FetAB permease component